MSDTITTNETSEQGQSNETATDNMPQGVSVEEFTALKESNEKLNKTLEKISKNYDRLNTEYQKKQQEIKRKENDQLGWKEYVDKQKAEMKAELEEQQKDLLTTKLNFEKTKLLNEKKLEADYLKIIQGKDVDSFALNITRLEDMIKKTVEERVNQRLAGANPLPKDKNKSKQTNENEYFTREEINALTREDYENEDIKKKAYKSLAFLNQKT